MCKQRFIERLKHLHETYADRTVFDIIYLTVLYLSDECDYLTPLTYRKMKNQPHYDQVISVFELEKIRGKLDENTL
jgi:hypothetical protein